MALHQYDPTFYEQRGYNKDIMPKGPEQRDTSAFNFFTLWMGAVHNIPNYTAVGGFLILGLSPLQVMFALVISSLLIGILLAVNGYAGSKYGIPFAIHLRLTYGDIGAKLPGILRGVIAGIAWFGLQTFAGSVALIIVLNKIFPGFSDIGGGHKFLGITVSGFIAFMLFWLINFAIGFGGGKILNKFTAVLNPLIYIIFGGMTIWGIKAGGGFSNILNYELSTNGSTAYPVLLGFFIVFNSLLAVWAAPGASVADFTQRAKSTKAQIIGQISGVVVAHVLFAFSSICILIGGSIFYGKQEWNILNIIERWDSNIAIVFAVGILLMTTISTNATSNIIPAGYQISALFPKKISYRKGVVIAGIVSILIMPWKMMENNDSIFLFLNMIGAILGPVAGVMVFHFYVVAKQKINLEKLYFDMKDVSKSVQRFNMSAYVATIIGVIVSSLGFIPQLGIIGQLSWFIGFFIAGLCYLALNQMLRRKGDYDEI
ncbi:allantoin permease [Staphylococcus delphini]|uniref:allantoin permease n=1 Tax=Staphylococcus delphini TaxID=53344 RepID=UPI0012D2AEE6|nr:putative allantoin permease [Staphylococcus delphini]MTV19318.1 putative allantoin permease [Staphylococcus delphini]